jgi:hypothetical protein
MLRLGSRSISLSDIKEESPFVRLHLFRASGMDGKLFEGPTGNVTKF